jgi:Calcineurin-like phosphoesterase
MGRLGNEGSYMSEPKINKNTFTWLHITDLHAGMKRQDWLWPTFKSQFYEDLKVVQESAGLIDTVIFSGDLTETGKRKDFDRLDEILSELWEIFAKHGSKPNLFVTPGNHDVEWPEKLKPEHHVLNQWWNHSNVHEDFFTDADSPYRLAVAELLREFCLWQERLSKSSIPIVTSQIGLLPGDQSASIKKGDLKIGLISLNSTWLQINKEDYHKKLHVDVRQLQSITNESPSAWCDAHDVTLLISHHPVDWLHSDSQAFWDSDINPPKRFDAHLCGHMHSASSQAVSTGGSGTRRSIQGASLFGLRQVSKNLDRIHGYSVGRASLANRAIEVRVWPRILTDRQDGSRALRRDQRFDVRESDGSYGLLEKQLSDEGDGTTDEEPPADQSTSLQVFPPTNSDEILRKVRYHLPLYVAHLNVRRVEQQLCVDGLSERHAVWLISDWGMGDGNSHRGALPSRAGEVAERIV